MGITLNIYSIVLFIVGSISGFIATFLFFRSGRAIRSFSMLMLGITIWSIAYAFELASSSLSEMLFWIDVEYIGIALMPGFWLVFCIQFIGYESLLSKRNIFLIFLLPTITLLLVWTNELHQLHYSSTSVVEVEGLNLLRLETGIWYIVHTIIFYSYLLAGIGFLLKKYFSTNHLIKKQISMILVAASVPWVANVTYLIGYRPLEYIDATPYAFAISGIFISVGLVWFRLFEILPVAREKIIEQTKDGILILNNTFQILDANAAAIDIIKNSSDKSLIGEIASDVFANQKEVLRLFEDSDHNNCELKINKQGAQKYFDISLNHFLNSRGVTSGYFMVFKDVTKNKQNQAELIAARQQAEEASKAKSEFLSHMGHEIRTPLAGIIGFVELMKDEDLNDEIKEYVSIVGTSAKSLLNIVNEILDLTKIESGSLKLLPESTNIEQLCKEAMDLFAWQANADPLKMYYTIGPNVPESIYADKTKLRQILINIIGNAVKFTDEGEIALIVERSNHNSHRIRFSVSDTGIGIAEEDQEKIFESFTQLKNKIESKKNVVGTGLGLTISNKLLNLMESKLQLESKLGEGSTFYFEIESM